MDKIPVSPVTTPEPNKQGTDSSHKRTKICCGSDAIPLRDGLATPAIMLIPPDENQDIALSKMFSDPETMKFLKFMMSPKGYDVGQARWRRKARDEGQKRKELVNYTIALKKSQVPASILPLINDSEWLPPTSIPIDSGAIEVTEPYVIVGCCGISEIDTSNHCCKSGIIVDSRFWRSGVSSASLYHILKFAFKNLNMHRVALETTEMNIGMRGWLESVAGASLEAVRKDVLFVEGQGYIDSWDYAIFEDQWNEYLADKLNKRTLIN